jgi:hypothetical protein
VALLLGVFGGIAINVLMLILLVFWWHCYWRFGSFTISVLMALLLVFWMGLSVHETIKMLVLRIYDRG